MKKQRAVAGFVFHFHLYLQLRLRLPLLPLRRWMPLSRPSSFISRPKFFMCQMHDQRFSPCCLSLLLGSVASFCFELLPATVSCRRLCLCLRPCLVIFHYISSENIFLLYFFVCFICVTTAWACARVCVCRNQSV